MAIEITLEQIKEEISAAREKRKTPDLSKKDLRNLNLSSMNLVGIKL